MTERVEIGGRAPDFEYDRPDGSNALLADLWADGPAFLVWLRHGG